MRRLAHPFRSRRAGYTSLEVMLAVPSLTLLIIGSAAAVGIVCRTTETAGSVDAAVRGPAALERMALELECATGVVARSATLISVVTPDRTGDAVADTIAYSWSGTAGAPLLRQINGGAAESVVDAVQAFSLTHNTALINSVQVLQSTDVRMTAAATLPELSCRVRLLNEPTAP